MSTMDLATAYDKALRPECWSSIPASPISLPPVPKSKSHNRKGIEGRIPRPPNAFVLFRCYFLAKGIIPTSVESKQHNISRIAGECWRRMTLPEQQVWKDRAKVKAAEHMRCFPHYKFKPQKRVGVKRRYRAETRQEEEDHCTKVRVKYLPDKAGPILQPKGSSVRRARKSRAKRHVGDDAPPPRPSRPSRAQARNTPSEPLAIPRSPVNMNLLHLPSAQSDAKASLPVANATFDPALEPPVFYDDIPLPLRNNLEMEEEWLHEVTADVATPAPVEQQIPQIPGAHIPEQYDMASQGAIPPLSMMTMDSQDAQALYDSVPFCIPPSTDQYTHGLSSHTVPTFEGQNVSSTPYQYDTQQPSASTSSFDATCFSSAMGLETTEAFEALAGRSTQQPFPMTVTLTASESESVCQEMLQLLTPVFDTPNPMDTLTFSFDERALQGMPADFGVAGEYNLFGQPSEQGFFGFHVDPTLLDEVLDLDICSQ